MCYCSAFYWRTSKCELKSRTSEVFYVGNGAAKGYFGPSLGRRFYSREKKKCKKGQAMGIVLIKRGWIQIDKSQKDGLQQKQLVLRTNIKICHKHQISLKMA